MGKHVFNRDFGRSAVIKNDDNRKGLHIPEGNVLEWAAKKMNHTRLPWVKSQRRLLQNIPGPQQ